MEDGSVLPVLVESKEGYRNICELLTQAHLRSEKGSCAIRWSELPEFARGLVVLGSAGCQPAVCGRLPQTSGRSKRGRHPTVRRAAGGHRLAACAPRNPAEYAQRLIEAFGSGNVYIELQRHFIRGEERRNEQLMRSRPGTSICRSSRPMACNTPRPRGREVLDVFTCIREHTHLDAAGKLLTQNAERHLKSDARNARALPRSAGGDHEHRAPGGSPRRSLSRISATHFPIFRCRTATT